MIQPLKSLSTTLIGATGNCLLALTPQKQVICALSSSRQIVGVWPYGSLRTYWGGKERFGFNAGRRSPRGEGEFVFTTNQGEEIYGLLERSIKLVSLVSKSQVEESLPPDPTRSETPVPSSESDEEHPPSVAQQERSPPPVPSKPPELLKRISMVGGVTPPLPQPRQAPPPSQVPISSPIPMSANNMGGGGTEVSDTSPVYDIKRGLKSASTRISPRQGGIKNSEPQVVRARSLHGQGNRDKPQPFPPGVQVGLPPGLVLPPGLPPGDDDTYSHTTQYPQNFPRKPSIKTIEGDTLYHGLMRTESTKSASKSGNRAQQPAATEGQSSDLLYDLAYPPNSMQYKTMPAVPGDEYGSMGDPEEQKRLLAEKRLIQNSGKMLSGDNLSFGAQLRKRTDTIDGGRGESGGEGVPYKLESISRQTSDQMTTNPLYGSTENVLGAGFTKSNSASPSSMAMDPLVGMDLTDNMVTNPVYGEHTPRQQPKAGATNYDPNRTTGVRAEAVERPVSPLEQSLVCNPLYSEHRIVQQPNAMGVSSRVPGPEGANRQLDSALQNTAEPDKQDTSKGVDMTSTVTDNSSSQSTEQGLVVNHGGAKLSEAIDGKRSATASPSKAPPMQAATDHLSPTKQPHSSPAKPGLSPQRDPHGYSKVDKKKEKAAEEVKKDEQAGSESPPPPVPPRKYSDASDDEGGSTEVGEGEGGSTEVGEGEGGSTELGGEGGMIGEGKAASLNKSDIVPPQETVLPQHSQTTGEETSNS